MILHDIIPRLSSTKLGFYKLSLNLKSFFYNMYGKFTIFKLHIFNNLKSLQDDLIFKVDTKLKPFINNIICTLSYQILIKIKSNKIIIKTLDLFLEEILEKIINKTLNINFNKIIDNVSIDPIVKLLILSSDENFNKIINNTPNDLQEDLIKKFIVVLKFEHTDASIISATKLLYLINSPLNKFAKTLSNYISLKQLMILNTSDINFDEIVNNISINRLIELIDIAPSEDIKKIIGNISNDILVKLIYLTSREYAENIVDNISIQRVGELIKISPRNQVEKITNCILSEQLSEIIINASSEDTQIIIDNISIQMLSILIYEAVIEEKFKNFISKIPKEKHEAVLKYRDHQFHIKLKELETNANVNIHSNKFGCNSDNDSGIGSNDENSDTESLGETIHL